MNVSMVHTADDQRFLFEGEVTSPELVLVDPELASRARARLGNPGEKEALARIASQLQRAPASQRPIDTPPLEGTKRGYGRWAAPVAAAAAVATAFLLTDARVEFGKTPASADTALEVPEPTTPAPTTPAASAPESTAPANPRPTPTQKTRRAPRTPAPTRPARSPARTEPQRFAWAPIADATAYRVELFRKQARVFATDTRRPAVTIPARWTFAGRDRRLTPGEYRWYVWPVIAGRQSARAIVQSRLTVQAR
jgi:hypothetical protein